MHKILMLLVLSGGFSIPLLALSAEVDGMTATGACTSVDQDLARELSATANNKFMMGMPPEEEKVGQGSACFYLDFIMQIDVLLRTTLSKRPSPARATGNRSAMLAIAAAFGITMENMLQSWPLSAGVPRRTYTIQMDVPMDSTAEAIKPKLAKLAESIVARLKLG